MINMFFPRQWNNWFVKPQCPLNRSTSAAQWCLIVHAYKKTRRNNHCCESCIFGRILRDQNISVLTSSLVTKQDHNLKIAPIFHDFENFVHENNDNQSEIFQSINVEHSDTGWTCDLVEQADEIRLISESAENTVEMISFQATAESDAG